MGNKRQAGPSSASVRPVSTLSQFDSLLSYRILFVAWTAVWLVSYVHYRVLTGIHENLFFGLLSFAACYYLWLPLTPVMLRLERSFPITRPLSWRNLLLLLLLGFPICYVTSLLALNTRVLLDRVLHLSLTPTAFTARVPVPEANLQISLFLALLGLSASLRYLAEMRQQERYSSELALDKAKLEGALREAELETLRMRLNPHFLFNCLQNASSLAAENPKAASTMLARLGDLLRVALSDDYQAQITLRREIALTRAYVAIEQIRFGDRLSVLFSMDPLAESIQVPSLLLQPLVENALKHGLSRQGRGLVSISSSMEAGMLILTVRDNGTGLEENKGEIGGFGIGLTATRERLHRIYGERQSLSLRNLPEGGAEVRLSLLATQDPSTEEGSTIAGLARAVSASSTQPHAN